MNLLRFRKRVTTLELPNGRKVKVTVNDANSTQHVEDGDHLHATARPPALRVVLRKVGSPRVVKDFQYRDDVSLWAPVPEVR